MGVLNTAADKQLRAIVGNVAVEPGGLALSSQSGALGIALLGQAAARQLGISGFVSLGNRADVSTNDLLEYWAQDERTATIALYVETFGNPRRSLMIARRVSRTKPILVMTGGRALERGAASSHTAAALREEAVVDAMFRAAGVLRPASTEALFDVAAVLERQPLPRGRRVAVITNSGGLGRLATDACERHGLTVVRPDDSTLDLLRRYFPAADRIDNPLDMGIHARAADYRTAVTALCGDPAVDAVLVLCAAIAGSDPHAVLDAVEAAAGGRTCIVASVIGADGRLPERREWRVPNVAFAETAASAVAMAADRREWLSRRLGQVPRLPGFDAERVEALVASRATPGEARWLAADDTEQILAAAGIPYVPARLCPDVDAALTAALDIDGPTALKAHFPPPAHAADIDAVLIGVQGERGVRAGWRELERRVRDAGRDWHGALVQPLAGAGADVLVGVVAEADLGPLIGLGMGGRYAALSGDVAFRVAPLTDVDADELIAASRAVRAWLAGFRGAPPLDGAALRDLLVRFSKLVEHAPDLVEADLNPVRLTTAGCAVLDARIRLERRLPRSSVRTW
jgi:acyl-CoA synthetase (NDP forming)